MTETKIPFTKKSVRQIPISQLAPGTKGVELEIQTDFHMSSLSSLKGIVHGPIQDAPFEKIAFVFHGEAEKVYYDALLDSKNQNFELSFDKEQIFLNVDGFVSFIDKSKPEINMRPGSNSLVIFLESKFTGIINLEANEERERERERRGWSG
jgi:hypothetical protein